MPEIRQTQAFILRTVAYGERDLIVTFYGRDTGRFAALARSARTSSRRFGGSLMPLRALDVNYTLRPGRDLCALNEASVTIDYPGIESSYEKIALASYMTELVRATTWEGESGKEVFDLLQESFAHVASCEPTQAMMQILVRHFELRLLQTVGAMPALDGCHRCGLDLAKMDKFRCSRDGEGLICQACSPQVSRFGILEPDVLDALSYLAHPHGDAPAALTELKKRMQIKRVLESSLNRVLDDSPLKSRALLDSLIEAPL